MAWSASLQHQNLGAQETIVSHQYLQYQQFVALISKMKINMRGISYQLLPRNDPNMIPAKDAHVIALPAGPTYHNANHRTQQGLQGMVCLAVLV